MFERPCITLNYQYTEADPGRISQTPDCRDRGWSSWDFRVAIYQTGSGPQGPTLNGGSPRDANGLWTGSTMTPLLFTPPVAWWIRRARLLGPHFSGHSTRRDSWPAGPGSEPHSGLISRDVIMGLWLY